MCRIPQFKQCVITGFVVAVTAPPTARQFTDQLFERGTGPAPREQVYDQGIGRAETVAESTGASPWAR